MSFAALAKTFEPPMQSQAPSPTQPSPKALGISGQSERPHATQSPYRKQSGPAVGRHVPPIVGQVLSAPGTPLETTAREFFEPRFGCDFAHVKIHADNEAAASARSVGAPAYTVGNDLVFGDGQYAPETETGRWLLAHELAHVRQQQDRRPERPIETEPRHSAVENDAEKAAALVMGGSSPAPLQSAPHGLYRAPPPSPVPGTIPAGRRVIIQWGDDRATIANVEALRTGNRGGPNAAGSSTVIKAGALTPDSLADAREVVVVIHGAPEKKSEGQTVTDPGGQPRATHGSPGLAEGAEGPVEAISPEAMASKLTGAGFGKGRWTNYRVRLVMCYAGVGETESYSAKLGTAIAANGVSNETVGLRGAVTATGGVKLGSTKGPSTGPQQVAPGEPVAANYYPAYKGTPYGQPGTRQRRDFTPAAKPPQGAAAPETAAPTEPVPQVQPPAGSKLSPAAPASPEQVEPSGGGVAPKVEPGLETPGPEALPSGTSLGQAAKGIAGGVALGAGIMLLDMWLRKVLTEQAAANIKASLQQALDAKKAEIARLQFENPKATIYARITITTSVTRVYADPGDRAAFQFRDTVPTGDLKPVELSTTFQPPVDTHRQIGSEKNWLDKDTTTFDTHSVSIVAPVDKAELAQLKEARRRREQRARSPSSQPGISNAHAPRPGERLPPATAFPSVEEQQGVHCPSGNCHEENRTDHLHDMLEQSGALRTDGKISDEDRKLFADLIKAPPK